MVRNRESKGFNDDDGEERRRNPYLPCSSNVILTGPKLPFRNKVSVCRWDEEMGMAEVVEKKGSIWSTTGIIRSGKLYCHVEEIAFLAEIGAMEITFDERTLSVRDIYEKIASRSASCFWKSFEAYRHLKQLGYIIQRRGIPWSLKNEKISQNPSGSKIRSSLYNEEALSILLQDLQMNELKPMFDVYLPNSKFRKSFPGEPNFLLCILSESPPSRLELEKLEKQYGDAALKFCYVDHGRVSFFTFDKILLPTLP